MKDKPELKSTRTRLTAYDGTSIPVQGKRAVQIPHENKTYDVPIIVADTDVSPIHLIHLIKRVLSISKGESVFFSKFKDYFGELGILPGYDHITFDPNIKPIINTGGARGVMVIVVGNGHGDTSSNPAFHIAPWERYESNYSPSSYG